MYKHKLIGRAFLFGIALHVLVIGITPTSVSAGNEIEILKITVGEPTKLSDAVMQNMSTVMVSRTGVAAVLYVKPGIEPRHPEKTGRGTAMGYRVSTDGGETWSQEMIVPDEFGGGQCSGTLRDGGGVIIAAKDPHPSTEYTRAIGWKGDVDPSPKPEGLQKDWFDILYLRFADDMLSWQSEPVRLHVPKGVPWFRGEGGLGFAKGNMLYLPNGDLISPMSGALSGDTKERSWIVKSTDQGRTWRYYATIFYDSKDPNPELPGQYAGANEPSFVVLPNGQMLAMLRMQYSDECIAYKPMCVSWSNDLGRTWTRPVPTKPQLMCISPTLQVLDNGVVACEYGRPGFHVAFSLDNGWTWQDRVSFSHLPNGRITGQFDMVKVGPNKLVAVGSDAEGTKIWPITVERVRVSPARVTLQGRVQDQQGKPIVGAKVERSPNRYAAHSWTVGPADPGMSAKWREPYFDELMVGSTPVMGYRSIRRANGYPTVQTDEQGRFRFESVVKLGEYILTVEADGYAPQHRRVKVGPKIKPQEFLLKPGRKVCNQVIDHAGRPISGACVVLDRRHVHTDRHGYYHWSVASPTAKQVTLRVYRRYGGDYGMLKTTVPFSQLESEPITLKNR